MALDQTHSPACPSHLNMLPHSAGSITVIIVNFNSGQLLAQALASIEQQTRPADEVIVVDNCSRDNSLHDVDWDSLPCVRLLRLSENIGFAAATNLAAREAKSAWLAMLNCDAKANPGWLAAMEAAQDRHKNVSVFASVQALMDKPNTLDGAGDVMSVTGLAWRGGYGDALASAPIEGTCFGACAAGAYISRDLFLQLGGFEESFFCYLEDLDFAYRVQLAGQDCVLVPSAQIVHKGAASSSDRSWPLRMSSKNRILLLVRNTPLSLAMVTWPLMLFGLLMTVCHGARNGHFLAPLLGVGDAIRSLRPALDQRRRLSPPFFPPAKLVRELSWSPFAVLTRGSKVRSCQHSTETKPLKPVRRSYTSA